MKFKYPAIITHKKDDGEYYLVKFPDIPGCMTEGETLEEAIANAKEALTGVLKSIDSRSLTVPEPSKLNKKNVHYIEPDKSVQFALSLKKFRSIHKISQSTIAKELNITQQRYQKLENPKYSNPTLKTVEKLENLLKESLV